MTEQQKQELDKYLDKEWKRFQREYPDPTWKNFTTHILVKFIESKSQTNNTRK
tara:strand:+ start:108 stop:266 length:159 start_codon:yes stop_codon:yes gene_type:complete